MSDTEIPWSIPVHWTWTTIGDVAQVVGGGTPSTSDPANFVDGTIAWITPADLSGYRDKYISHGKRNLTQRGLDNSGARLLPKGAVLYSSRAPIGYVAIASNPVSTNQGFKSFVLQENLEPEFVYYYLQRAKPLVVGLASGTTFQEISGRNAAKIPLIVTPRAEQRQIVEAIESYFTRLDDAVASLERVQRNLKRYRASVLKAAVEGRLVPTEAELARAEGRTYEPASALLERILAERRRRWEEVELAKMKAAVKAPKDNKWKAKYKEPVQPDTDGLPELPEGWCWALVDALIWDGGYGTSRKCEPSAGGPPVLRIPNVQDSSISLDDLKFATGPDDLPPDGVLLPGDFVFIRTNGSKSLIGRGALVAQTLPRDCHFASYLIRLRLAANLVTAKWFALTWHTPVVRDQILEDAASSAGQHNVSLRAAMGYRIPLPPLAEQNRILSEAERLISVNEAASANVDAGAIKIAQLRQSILKWAFEGRLVDQDPTDESAPKLLERIKAERTVATSQQSTRRPRRAASKKNGA